MLSTNFKNFVLRLWLSIGEFFKHRPFQIMGIGLGTLVVVIMLAYSVATSSVNRDDINEIRSSVCSPSINQSNTQSFRCRQLLNELLRNASESQKNELRKIVKELP